MVPWDPRVIGWFSFTDMKQGLLSVGIGSRESRSGCLDVEKGESRNHWKMVIQGQGRGWRQQPETQLRPQTAPSPSF